MIPTYSINYFFKVVSFIALFFSFSCIAHSGTTKTNEIELYGHENEISVCKVNCSDLHIDDCTDGYFREIDFAGNTTIDINGFSKIKISSEAWTTSATCYSYGKLIITIRSKGITVVKVEEIPCRGKKMIDVPIALDGNSRNLSLSLKVGDWCTTLSKIKIIGIK